MFSFVLSKVKVITGSSRIVCLPSICKTCFILFVDGLLRLLTFLSTSLTYPQLCTFFSHCAPFKRLKMSKIGRSTVVYPIDFESVFGPTYKMTVFFNLLSLVLLTIPSVLHCLSSVGVCPWSLDVFLKRV